MISFNYEVDFQLNSEERVAKWLSNVIEFEDFREGEISYVFCSDEYLHKLNVEFLNHDTLTDIISFDYAVGKELHGEMFISIERVKENAENFNEEFENELKRVMVHGILHYCGYKDKSKKEAIIMREKENYHIDQFTSIQ